HERRASRAVSERPERERQPQVVAAGRVHDLDVRQWDDQLLTPPVEPERRPADAAAQGDRPLAFYDYLSARSLPAEQIGDCCVVAPGTEASGQACRQAGGRTELDVLQR